MRGCAYSPSQYVFACNLSNVAWTVLCFICIWLSASLLFVLKHFENLSSFFSNSVLWWYCVILPANRSILTDQIYTLLQHLNLTFSTVFSLSPYFLGRYWWHLYVPLDNSSNFYKSWLFYSFFSKLVLQPVSSRSFATFNSIPSYAPIARAPA